MPKTPLGYSPRKRLEFKSEGKDDEGRPTPSSHLRSSPPSASPSTSSASVTGKWAPINKFKLGPFSSRHFQAVRLTLCRRARLIVFQVDLSVPWSPGTSTFVAAKDAFLQRTLHRHALFPFKGAEFLGFEVRFEDVIGFQYSNPLVIDATLALEAKKVKRVLFESDAKLLAFYIRLEREAGLAEKVRREGGGAKKGTEGARDVDEVKDAEKGAEGNDGKREHETTFTYRTIQATFSDPMLPSLLRHAVMSDTRLLRLAESGLPSWAVFMGTHGLYYRPWMRRAANAAFIAISMLSLFIGFYDLYKNIPWARHLMMSLGRPVMEFVENHTVLRLSILLSYIIAKSPLLYGLGVRLQMLGRALKGAGVMVSSFVVGLTSWPVGKAVVVGLQVAWKALIRPFLWFCGLLASALKPIASILVPEIFGPFQKIIVQPAVTLGGFMVSWYSALRSLFLTGGVARRAVPGASFSQLWSKLFSKIIYVFRNMLLLLLYLVDACLKHQQSFMLSLGRKKPLSRDNSVLTFNTEEAEDESPEVSSVEVTSSARPNDSDGLRNRARASSEPPDVSVDLTYEKMLERKHKREKQK